MGTIKLLLQKELTIINNSDPMTKKETIISLAAFVGFLFFMGTITYAVLWGIHALLRYFSLPVDLLAVQVMGQVVTPFFYLVLLMLSWAALGFIWFKGREEFYHSPDLTLLVATPISTRLLFAFRFVRSVCFSFALMSIGSLPPLIAMGIVAGAPWYYYLFVLPVVYPLMIIVTSLGTCLLMLFVRLLSARWIMLITIIFNCVLAGLWIGFVMYGFLEMFPRLFDFIARAEPVLATIFPLREAVESLGYLLRGNPAAAFWSFLPLFLTSGVIFVGAMLAAEKLYWGGFARAQITEVHTRKKARPPREVLKRDKPAVLSGRKGSLVLAEWRKASRNYEMGSGAIGIVVPLIIFAVIAFVEDPPQDWQLLTLVFLIGSVGIFASRAIATFFAPPGSLKDAKILQEQYSLLKSMPLSGGEFIRCRWLALFLPQFLFAGVVLLLINLGFGSDFLATLVSLTILALLVGSTGALDLGINMARYAGRIAPGIFLMAHQALPIIYYILALGIIALGQAYTRIGFLGFMHYWPQGLAPAISGALFLALTGFTLYHSFRLATRHWEMMEV